MAFSVDSYSIWMMTLVMTIALIMMNFISTTMTVKLRRIIQYTMEMILQHVSLLHFNDIKRLIRSSCFFFLYSQQYKETSVQYQKPTHTHIHTHTHVRTHRNKNDNANECNHGNRWTGDNSKNEKKWAAVINK